MVKEKVTLMNAKLIYRNFSGKETEFNAPGARNFSIVLDDDLAQELMDKGYNVKVKPPREDSDDEGNFNTLKVNVKFGENPALHPQIFRIMNGKQIKLSEKNIGCLDYDNILNCDLRIRPYSWARAGRSGVAAYLESMYVTVEDDPLAAKYQSEHIDDYISDDEIPFG